MPAKRQIGIILFTFLISCSPRTDTNHKNIKGQIPPSISTLTVPDSTFKDFLLEFCFNEDFQKSRIKFPLHFNGMGTVSAISLSNWKYDPIYVNLEAVTDVWNGLKTDENSNERVFSWIQTQDRKSKNYYFVRKNKLWFLEKIEIIADSSTTSSEDFYSFLGRFGKDSVFQKERIKFPLDMITIDDNYDPVKTKVNMENWIFTKFYYDCDSVAVLFHNKDRKSPDTDKRILMIYGVENGINASHTFKKIDNKWMLIEYEDTSM